MTAALLAAFYAVMVCSLTYAWFRGGGAERVGVLLLLGFFLFRIVLRPLVPAQFEAVDPLAFAQDFIGFAGFMWIGLRARRYWPLIAAALQLLSLSAHLARVTDVPIHPWVYALTQNVPTLLVYFALALGTAGYQRRVRARKLSASFPDWPGLATAGSWPKPSRCSRTPASKRSSSPFMTPPVSTSATPSEPARVRESNSTTAT